MNKLRWIILIVTLSMIAGTVVFLRDFKKNPKLSPPGVLTRPIADSKDPVKVDVVLPEKVLDYESITRAPAEIVTNTLPADTSFGERLYTTKDGFGIQLNVVLMGRDRTSHHKPQYCLTGSGWTIDPNDSRPETIRMDKPVPYDLPAHKLVVSQQFTHEGQNYTRRGVFIYWFVSDKELSGDESGFERMWSMGRELVKTGILHRWSYVMCFSVCAPGQEDATFERMKTFLKEAVPEFQLVPPPGQQAAAETAKP